MESVHTARQAVTIDLEAVAQTWLDDPTAVLDLDEQSADVGEVVGAQRAGVLGDDGAEQDPAESGRWIDREDEMAEGETPGRLGRSRVMYLEFGQEHSRSVGPAGLGVPSCAQRRSDPGSAGGVEFGGCRADLLRVVVVGRGGLAQRPGAV